MDWEGLSRALAARYGSPRHGNPTDPTDCLFYLMLSRKTPIRTAARVYKRLRATLRGWDGLLGLTQVELVRLLWGSGLEEIRAGHLLAVAGLLRDRFGAVTLEPLRQWPDDECLAFLMSLPGMGMKTALCVMLYGLDRPVFPADAHCIRVLKRMGVIDARLAHRPAQRELARIVPGHLGYVLHVNLVAHGQQICTARRPRCAECVVANYCLLGEAAQQAAEGQLPYGESLQRT